MHKNRNLPTQYLHYIYKPLYMYNSSWTVHTHLMPGSQLPIDVGMSYSGLVLATSSQSAKSPSWSPVDDVRWESIITEGMTKPNLRFRSVLLCGFECIFKPIYYENVPIDKSIYTLVVSTFKDTPPYLTHTHKTAELKKQYGVYLQTGTHRKEVSPSEGVRR